MVPNILPVLTLFEKTKVLTPNNFVHYIELSAWLYEFLENSIIVFGRILQKRNYIKSS
jgi:hypothetical protein